MVRRCNPRRRNRGTSRSRHIIKNSPLIGAAGAIGAIIGPIGGLAGIASFVGVVMKGIEIREGSAHRLATQYEESINHINEHLVRESTPDEFVTSTYLHSIERVWQHDRSYRSDVPLLATFVGKLANSSQPDTQNGVRHDVQKIIDMLGKYNIGAFQCCRKAHANSRENGVRKLQAPVVLIVAQGRTDKGAGRRYERG